MVPKSYVPICHFFPFSTSSKATSETPEKAIFSVNTNLKVPKVQGINDLAESSVPPLSSHLFHCCKGTSLHQTEPNEVWFLGWGGRPKRKSAVEVKTQHHIHRQKSKPGNHKIIRQTHRNILSKFVIEL